MIDKQIYIDNDIKAIQSAMDSLMGYSGIITPRDRIRLSQLYIRGGDLLIKMMKE